MGQTHPVPTDPESRPPGPRPPAPNVAFLTMAVGRRVRAQVDAGLSEHNLTYRHLSALGHLAANPDLSYTELAHRGGVTVQSMKATLVQLQQRGAVEQRNSARRGLRAQLRVTDAGTELLRHGTAVLTDVEQRLVVGLPEDQRTLLGAGLFAMLTRLLEETP